MTVQEFYDLVKGYGLQDCELKIVTEDSSDRITVEPENTSIYHDEVIIYP